MSRHSRAKKLSKIDLKQVTIDQAMYVSSQRAKQNTIKYFTMEIRQFSRENSISQMMFILQFNNKEASNSLSIAIGNATAGTPSATELVRARQLVLNHNVEMNQFLEGDVLLNCDGAEYLQDRIFVLQAISADHPPSVVGEAAAEAEVRAFAKKAKLERFLPEFEGTEKYSEALTRSLQNEIERLNRAVVRNLRLDDVEFINQMNDPVDMTDEDIEKCIQDTDQVRLDEIDAEAEAAAAEFNARIERIRYADDPSAGDL